MDNIDMNVIKELMAANSKREWENKKENFRKLNQVAKKGEILVTGSSLMEQFPINELLMSRGIHKTVYNRGIGGYTTTNMLETMDEMIFDLEPSKIFINIGTNDFNAPDFQIEELLCNYKEILNQIKERLPKAAVYTMAYYPTNDEKVMDIEWIQHMLKNRTPEKLGAANQGVKELAEGMGYEFIDVNDGLMNDKGRLKLEYTIEGVHMYANAYSVVLDNLISYL